MPRPPPRPQGWPQLCHTTTSTALAWLHRGCLERSRTVPKLQYDLPAPHTVGCPHSTPGTPPHPPLRAHEGDIPRYTPIPTLHPNPQDESRTLQAQGSRPQSAPSQFIPVPQGLPGCRGMVPRQPLAAVPVVFSRGCGGSRRPGNGVPGTARPQTAFAGSATAGRQVQLARGRSGHSAGGHGRQAAVRHPRTPGFGGTVPPAWAGSRQHRPDAPGGAKPLRAAATATHRIAARLAAGGRAAVCHCHVPLPCPLSLPGSRGSVGTAEATAGARGPSPGPATSHPPAKPPPAAGRLTHFP